MQATFKSQVRATSLGLLLLSLAACSTPNPLYCDESSDCSHLRGRTFCDIDAILPDSELKNTCVDAPDGEVCNRAQACVTAERPVCNNPSMGVCVECTSNDDCEGDCDLETEACIPPVILCTPGTGGDSTCVTTDPNRPFCTAVDTCSECVTSLHCLKADKAVCDAVDFSCRSCEAHAECGSFYCEQDGLCADPGTLLYVDTTGSGNACTQAEPCLSLDNALTKITEQRKRIVILPGNYAQRLSINDKVVELIGIGDVVINADLSGSQNSVRVEGSSDVLLSGITFEPVQASENTDILRCDGPSAQLRLDRVKVSKSRDLGAYVTDCEIEINASTFIKNAGGAIEVTGAGGFSITNSVIADNLTTGNRPAVGLASSGTLKRFDFNTVVGNASLTGLTAGVNCTTTGFQATSNIVYGNTTNTDGASGANFSGCQWQYSNVEGIAATNNNISADPLLEGNGDFHLKANSPCIDAGDPATTLLTDIDGEARNQGAAPDIGADERE